VIPAKGNSLIGFLSMGKRGTAIKKTAENCILTDDNYCQNSILFFNLAMLNFVFLEENGIQM